ncbi:MAG: hypothetical protein AAF567_22265 [Actinomycetota bacterium]
MTSASEPPGSQLNRAYVRHLGSVPANDDGPVWLARISHHSRDRALNTDELEIGSGLCVFAGEQRLEGRERVLIEVVKFPTRRSLATALDAVTPASGWLDSATAVVGIPSPSIAVPAHLSVPDWTQVPHPASDDDPPVVAVHLAAHRDPVDGDQGLDDLAAFSRTLAEASVPHGARSTQTFYIEESVIVGTRDWDQLRLTRYPSGRAFEAVEHSLAESETFRRLTPQLLSDQQTFVTRPIVDRLAQSLHD